MEPSGAVFRLKPHRQLATAPTPDGALLTLHEHDGTFSIRVNGRELMHSSMSESERVLGTLTAERVPQRGAARVLIGGLGLGFTLRAVLDRVGREATIEVAELVPAIVEWNRGLLGAVHGGSLGDGRVRVQTGDVFELLARAAPARFDAIALDIDNGPSAMVQRANARLYDERGVALLARALKPGGRLVVWSAGPDCAFERRLRTAGFRTQIVRAKSHAGARQEAVTLFVGDLPATATTTTKGNPQQRPRVAGKSRDAGSRPTRNVPRR